MGSPLGKRPCLPGQQPRSSSSDHYYEHLYIITVITTIIVIFIVVIIIIIVIDIVIIVITIYCLYSSSPGRLEASLAAAALQLSSERQSGRQLLGSSAFLVVVSAPMSLCL